MRQVQNIIVSTIINIYRNNTFYILLAKDGCNLILCIYFSMLQFNIKEDHLFVTSV